MKLNKKELLALVVVVGAVGALYFFRSGGLMPIKDRIASKFK